MRERAESWIKTGELTGMPTEYPLDTGADGNPDQGVCVKVL
ncbi:hypothetical protein [Streptosporangium sp. NPDC023615]